MLLVAEYGISCKVQPGQARKGVRTLLQTLSSHSISETDSQSKNKGVLKKVCMFSSVGLVGMQILCRLQKINSECLSALIVMRKSL